MKKILISICLLVLGISINAQDYIPYLEKVWNKSVLNNTRPTWFGYSANTNPTVPISPLGADITRGFVAKNGKLYVATRNATAGVAPVVRILNALTGDSIGILKTTNLVPSPGHASFPINDIEANDEGEIMTANLALSPTAPNNVFKVYRWKSDTATADVVLSFTIPAANMRMGDMLTVKGSFKPGKKAVIFTANHGATVGIHDKVYKWTLTGGVPDSLRNGNSAPKIITISKLVNQVDNTAGFAADNVFGNLPKVEPLGVEDTSSIIVDATNIFPTLCNSEGVVKDSLLRKTMESSSYPGGSGMITYNYDNKLYMSSVRMAENNGKDCQVFTTDITNKSLNSGYGFLSSSIGAWPNGNLSSDLSSDTIKGDRYIFLLNCNSGLMAFKMAKRTISARVELKDSLVFRGGWRKGAKEATPKDLRPDKDTLIQARPDFITGTSYGIAMTKEKIYIADTSNVRILDIKDGNYIGKLVTNASKLHDVNCDSKGHILAANCPTAVTGNKFMIYYWENEDSKPDTIFSVENTPIGRLGDFFSVYGDVKSKAVIYAGVGSTTKVLRIDIDTTKDKTSKIWPITAYKTINISGKAMGAYPSISYVNDSMFYVNGQSITPTLYKTNGDFYGSMSKDFLTQTAAPNMQHVNKYFEFKSNKYLLSWNYDYADWTRIVNVNNYPSRVIKTDAVVLPYYLGQESNSFLGDVDYVIDGDTLKVGILSTNNGIGLYKYVCKSKSELSTAIEGQYNKQEALTANQFAVYPNPVCNELFVEHKSGVAKIEVFNVLGIKIYEVANLEKATLSDLNQGIYLVRVTSNSGAVSIRKVVKK